MGFKKCQQHMSDSESNVEAVVRNEDSTTTESVTMALLEKKKTKQNKTKNQNI